MKPVITILCMLSWSCAAVWHNPDRPFTTKPVKCSDSWVPTTLDAAGFSLATMNALYYKSDESLPSKKRDDMIAIWLMLSSVFMTSMYMGVMDLNYCEVESGS